MTTDVGNVRPIKIEDEMRGSYLDYAMSVIVSRALPDVRDGLKPVHRRILYAMDDMGVRPGTSYKKSARIVGEVLGKYHPHGDSSVYDAMVRLAQTFSMRYLLVDGQGNFGSVDNDPPAAMRYTEARLAAIAQEMLADIDRDTVDFTPNFDGSINEPTVLPARIPNLLLNGSSGIAVGMATNIPPHNLKELCEGITHLIENPEATSEDLMRFIHGPDFPTAGLIEGREGIRNAYTTGHGRIVLRAKAFIEESRANRHQIIVSELPFQINKAALVEKIADLVKEKKIDGISDLRDESDRQGMRIVIELKRDANPTNVLNNLYKQTAMRSAFFANMLALVGGQPRVLTLKSALSNFINFRREVITRRSRYDLGKAKEREHILLGLKTALDNLDAVISTIRRSQNVETARTNLMRGFSLSQVQAQAILDMQLRRLAALERKKIEDELTEVLKTIAYLEDLLANPKKIDFLIKDEANDLKKTYGDERRTQITDQELTDYKPEDLIPHQEVVVTLSHRGYIKRMPSSTYRVQHRGGRGITGMVTRETDVVRHLQVVDTHDNILFFTQRGRVFQAKAHEILDASRTTRGLPLINLIEIEANERVTTMLSVRQFEKEEEFLLLATRNGEVKKTPLAEFAAVRRNGLKAWPISDDEELIGARLARDTDDALIVTRKGQAIRFSVGSLRSASRMSGGVRGIRLAGGDSVVAMEVVRRDACLLSITEQGFGKRTRVEEYPVHGRGGGGVITHVLNQKTGLLASAMMVLPKQELMIITANGIIIRTAVEKISAFGRNSQGVTVMNVGQGDSVVDIACVNGGDQTGEPQPSTRRARAAASPDAASMDSPPQPAVDGAHPSPEPPSGKAPRAK